MNYNHFLDEFDTYNQWNRIEKREKKEEDNMWGSNDSITFDSSPFVKGVITGSGLPGGLGSDHINFGDPGFVPKDDRVNSPSHYTSGKTEVIDVIEDAVKTAPSAIYGMLQGQVLKYMLRVWLKDNPLEDLKKAEWYLKRLIEHYNNPPGEPGSFPPGKISTF